MPTLQATVAMALLPIGVPVRSPRSVSVAGVNGWYCGELSEPGRHRGDEHEAAAEEGQQGEEHRCVARGLDALGGEAERGGEPDQREREQRQDADRGEPLERAGGGAEAERDGDAEHDAEAERGFG